MLITNLSTALVSDYHRSLFFFFFFFLGWGGEADDIYIVCIQIDYSA